jgi:hypothetical protein
MKNPFTESIIEQAAIDWLKELGYAYLFGPEITFNGIICTLASLRFLRKLMRGK